MSSVAKNSSAPPDVNLVIVPLRHTGRKILTFLVVIVAILCITSVAFNANFQWQVVGEYLLDFSVLNGLYQTLFLTVSSMAVGIVGGAVLALMRDSTIAILKVISGWYIWFFRGTPLLVQILFLYNISALYPSLSVGIPHIWTVGNLNANDVLSPVLVAIVALAAHEAAYMCEIIRSGLLSVSQGQIEAAKAVGMRPGLVVRRIVFPQAMRVIIPPTGNQIISMLKATSLVSVVAYPELLYSVTSVYTRTFQTIPLLLVATIWYLVVTSVLTFGQRRLERRFSRDIGSAENGSTQPPASAAEAEA
jgi:polar amino acid transport system permease protein